MTFTYNANIPSAPDDPADDQPVMKTNAAAINNFVNVDHVGFNKSTCGQHTQVTYNTFLTFPPPAVLGTVSRSYTQQGDVSSDPQLYFYNLNNSFLLNCVKAFGVFDTVNAGSATLSNSYNCNSITTTLAGTSSTFVIAFPTGAVSGTNFIVILTPQYAVPIPGTIVTQISYATAANQISIKTGGAGRSIISQVNFVVIQA